MSSRRKQRQYFLHSHLQGVKLIDMESRRATPGSNTQVPQTELLGEGPKLEVDLLFFISTHYLHIAYATSWSLRCYFSCDFHRLLDGCHGVIFSTVSDVFLRGYTAPAGIKRVTVHSTGLDGCFYYMVCVCFTVGSMGKGNASIPCTYPYCYGASCC